MFVITSISKFTKKKIELVFKMIIFGLVGFGEFLLKKTLSGGLEIYFQSISAHIHERFFFFPTGAIHELFIT
jgi:hypothetical protein